MEPREIEVCAVVGGRDVDPATIEQHLGLTGNYNWRRRDGDDVEWGVRHVVHTRFLTEPGEFVLDLDLTELVLDPDLTELVLDPDLT